MNTDEDLGAQLQQIRANEVARLAGALVNALAAYDAAKDDVERRHRESGISEAIERRQAAYAEFTAARVAFNREVQSL